MYNLFYIKTGGISKMKRGDVSFTFLDRVNEIELNIKDSRWQSALALALTLPDICGGIAFPDIVKRYRDGRIILDRQNQPTRDVGNQYIHWFDEYASNFFKLSPSDSLPYICGERCWQLRCEYLHQNKGFSNNIEANTVRFHLGINCKTSICQLDSTQITDNQTDIRIDIEQFCLRMCRAAKNYYYSVYHEKDFSMYNTPVLDFIQAQSNSKTNPFIAIICGNKIYAQGLSMSLQGISDQIIIFSNAEDVKKALGKRKPVLWIVTEDQLIQNQQPWNSGLNKPVIFLAKSSSKSHLIKKNDGKLLTLTYPVNPAALRNAVNQCLL